MQAPGEQQGPPALSAEDIDVLAEAAMALEEEPFAQDAQDAPALAAPAAATPFEQGLAELKAKDSSLRRRGRRTALSPDQVEQIKGLRLKGLAQWKLAKLFHVSPDRIRQIVESDPGRGTPLAPEEGSVRATKHFIALEPPTPQKAELASIVRRRTGRPEPFVDEVGRLSRALEGLAAYETGVDDPTVLANTSSEIEAARISQAAKGVLLNRLKQPRHNKTQSHADPRPYSPQAEPSPARPAPAAPAVLPDKPEGGGARGDGRPAGLRPEADGARPHLRTPLSPAGLSSADPTVPSPPAGQPGHPGQGGAEPKNSERLLGVLRDRRDLRERSAARGPRPRGPVRFAKQ